MLAGVPLRGSNRTFTQKGALSIKELDGFTNYDVRMHKAVLLRKHQLEHSFRAMSPQWHCAIARDIRQRN